MSVSYTHLDVYKRQDYGNAAYHSQLLAHHRVNKVGMPFGEQVIVSAGAVVEPHSRKLAAAHCRL